jgi:hypothetical protein
LQASNDPQTLSLIASILNMPTPVRIVQIPLHGLSKTTLEGLIGDPVEMLLYPGSVYGIALVVTWSIDDEANQVPMGDDTIATTRTDLIEQITDCVDDLEVSLLVMATDVVSFTNPALSDDPVEGASVVLDMQPVADLLPVSIDWEGLAIQGIEDH